MKTNQHIEDKNWELFAKSLYDQDPQISSEEKDSVMNVEFLSQEDSNQLLKIAKQVDLYFDLNKYPSEEAWTKVESRIHNQISSDQTKIQKLLSTPMFRLSAAILVSAILLFSGYKFFYSSATVKMLEIAAVDQVLNTFTLPDGTLVSLNSDTKVFYPQQFGNNTREVKIEGEAFFEVKPDHNKPFIISAGKAQIKVLGTSFSVSAYPDAKLIEVIVQTGKVQVKSQTSEPSEQSDELILTPGDKGTLVYANNTLLKTTNEDPNFLAWKTRNLIFRATSLHEVIGNLEKVYKVNIRLADPKLNERLLTVQFNNEPLDFVLKVIEKTLKIEVQETNGQYILKARS